MLLPKLKFVEFRPKGFPVINSTNGRSFLGENKVVNSEVVPSQDRYKQIYVPKRF